MSEKTWYRPGLLFKAHKNSRGHQEVCRGKYDQKAFDGTIIDTTRELLAEFGVYNGEYEYTNPDGNLDHAADMHLGYFDLDAQAELKGWTAAEKEIVARHMVRMAEARPGGDFTLYSKKPAEPPWPTYDETHHKSIPGLAQQLGLAGEALAYEKENKNRRETVEHLEEALAESQRQEVQEEELTAA